VTEKWSNVRLGAWIANCMTTTTRCRKIRISLTMSSGKSQMLLLLTTYTHDSCQHVSTLIVTILPCPKFPLNSQVTHGLFSDRPMRAQLLGLFFPLHLA